MTMNLHRNLVTVSAWVTVVLVASPPAHAPPGPTRVLTARVEQRELPRTITLVGKVQPLRRSTVGSEVQGIVAQVPVRQGDRVTAGQLLCKLDDKTAATRLAEATGRLDALRAALAELEAGTRTEDLARAKALYENEQAKFQRWVSERQRVKELYGDAEANQKEVYDTESGYLAAQQMMLAAKASYDAATAGPRREVIDQARFDVAEQQAVVDRYAHDLAATEIRAPFAGHVVQLHTEVGQWMAQGGAVAEMIDLSSVLVRVDVFEKSIAYCRAGDSASVKVDALDRTFNGTITHVIRQGDPAAHTFPVEIEVINESQLLAAGMFARVTLVGGPTAEAVAVPKDAVVQRRGVDYVCRVHSDERGAKAIPIPVTLGGDIGDWVAITSGNLAPGMEIVISGNERISYPKSVVIVDPSELATMSSGPLPHGRGSDSEHTHGAGS